jgi:anti-sigma regulatory factor (Ser/Thr protein kinase)
MATQDEAPPAERTVPVAQRADVALARQQAQRLARHLGFGSRRVAEIAIVVSELASNIVKYGVRGEIHLRAVEGTEPELVSGLVVVARDVGPPIHDLALALQDGFDDRGPIDPAVLAHRGGLGTGLGAMARLASRFTIDQNEHGKAITVTFVR